MMEYYQIGLTAIAAFIVAYLFTGSRWHTLCIIGKTLPRDVLGAYRFLKINILLWYWERKGLTVAKLFTKQVEKNPDKIVIIFEDQRWTYGQLDEYSNRLARYIRTQPMSRGDSVAVIMENRPEYVGTWLGLSKAGFVGALVNTNLRKDVLIHSIKAANSKSVIFGAELRDAIDEIKDKLPGVGLYQSSEKPDTPVVEGAVDLNKSMVNISSDAVEVDLSLGCPRDKLIYIYTSGTTGMPKAAVINNLRYMLMSCGVYYMLGLEHTDRVYDPLPLYHTAGGIIGVGPALCVGITVVLRRKFSASKFWADCIEHRCTVAQYIGEICRFLLSLPPSPNDTAHNVRLMYGNGLRPQIWESFVKRFNVEQIGEFYGATEGNSNLVNIDNRPGAVGFVPRFGDALYRVALLRIDDETGEPVRGPDGLCTRCKPDEPGIFVGKINPKKAVHDFRGYADEKESEKKIIRDVFKKGDRFFNSGDILVMDELGYFYFKDRRGDTFRWKGENVATAEVEAVISNIIGLRDSVVYGVEVPGNEGKAGMVAIYDPHQTLCLQELADGLKKSLPAYARPLFVRVLAELPLTGTYKLKKGDLQVQGFDITQIKDPVYFLEKSGNYVRLTEQLHHDLVEEKIRV
ncbi:long-chain fatty acid transport protein 4 [Fopius arisanus]|uniref:Very long-chain fatty acid transport protein n=1 Tax=Fopius arisanus TaxID=64838 RepID=A0A9R1U074_9HYME|nr:PREDICTED: long-chain fatty acid transport protein 4-like [Fopius arisanus]